MVKEMVNPPVGERDGGAPCRRRGWWSPPMVKEMVNSPVGEGDGGVPLW